MIGEVFIALGIILFLFLFINKTHEMLVDDRVFVEAFDGRKYRVRNTQKKKETANVLARLNGKIVHFLTRLQQTDSVERKPMIARMIKRYNPATFSEGKVDKRFTSYTVNKGEEVVLCLRTRDGRDALYDENLIFYVTLHELAHIASVTEEHNDEFNDNFAYLLSKASQWGLFKKVNEPFHYCGMDVNGM
jgi:predicted metal-dependent hydrolase